MSNNICHENIAKAICYEMLKDDNTFKCKTYLKVLQLADLSEADYVSLKSIHELVDEIHMHIEDKALKKTAKRYADSLHDMLKKMPDYVAPDADQQQSQASTDAPPPLNNKDTTSANEPHADLVEQVAVADTSASSSSAAVDEIIDPNFRKLIKSSKASKNTASAASNAKTTTPSVRLSRVAVDSPASRRVVEQSAPAHAATAVADTSIRQQQSSPCRASLPSVQLRRLSPRTDADLTINRGRVNLSTRTTSSSSISSSSKRAAKKPQPQDEDSDEEDHDDDEEEEEEEEKNEDEDNNTLTVSRNKAISRSATVISDTDDNDETSGSEEKTDDDDDDDDEPKRRPSSARSRGSVQTATRSSSGRKQTTAKAANVGEKISSGSQRATSQTLKAKQTTIRSHRTQSSGEFILHFLMLYDSPMQNVHVHVLFRRV